jgi:hypothetical protein
MNGILLPVSLIFVKDLQGILQNCVDHGDLPASICNVRHSVRYHERRTAGHHQVVSYDAFKKNLIKKHSFGTDYAPKADSKVARIHPVAIEVFLNSVQVL